MHQPTIEKLHDLRLGAMANALTAQLQQPEIDAMPFAERLALLVDIQQRDAHRGLGAASDPGGHASIRLHGKS